MSSVCARAAQLTQQLLLLILQLVINRTDSFLFVHPLLSGVG